VIQNLDFEALVRVEEAVPDFAYVVSPFNFNHASVAAYPPEVIGHYLLRSLCRRLGWSSLSGKKLLDFGCGSRFAQTIVNLQLEIAEYAGVDINVLVIEWLKANIRDPRFRFEHLAMRNRLYTPYGSGRFAQMKSLTARGFAAGADLFGAKSGALRAPPEPRARRNPSDDSTRTVPLAENALVELSLSGFDAACMFSVVTHQEPADAAAIFAALHLCVRPRGALYFTAFTDDKISDFAEASPATPGLHSTYNPDFLIEIVRQSGWTVECAYARSTFQQTGFVCRKLDV